MPSNALIGKRTNWSYGINNPSIAEIKGTLKVLFEIGIFWGKIRPFLIWHCGTVADMNGYRTPLQKLGE